MTEGDGGEFFALLGNNFNAGTLEPCREMLLDPYSVSGLSDAGAHVMMISDCSSSTFHLTHWVRDRTQGRAGSARAGGPQAHRRAGGDVRVRRPGRDRPSGDEADLNVIDFDNLTIAGAVRSAPTCRPAPAGSSSRPPATSRRSSPASRCASTTRTPAPGPATAPQRPRATADGRARRRRRGRRHRRARLGARAGACRQPGHAHRARRRTRCRPTRGRVRVEPHRARRRFGTRTCSSAWPARSCATASPTCCRRSRTSASNPRRSATTRASRSTRPRSR